ncbi:Uma2 family endonuclease [Streptomyces sp. NPDC017966]|uniref:Uma2 family endonuclease n=1 Tax=Streptomyces sp. NPDC017966 TaxID=3365023 RepID=UPI0037900EC2
MDVCDGDYVKADNEWDELRWIRERTDAPKGCRVEIVEGLVTVTPLARARHHIIAAQVHRRLHEATPEDWGAHQWWDIAVPERLGLYVPDLVVVRENTGGTGDGGLCPAAAAELVVEITSKATASRDRTVKPEACATGGVPLYLLIDGLAPGGAGLHAPRRTGERRLPRPRRGSVRRTDQAPRPLRPRHRHRRVPRDLTHPSNVATTTSTGTDSTVDTRIASLASFSPTR